jgi:hypothetical protein
MRWMSDDDDDYEDDDSESAEHALGLAHWLEAELAGDPRFASVELHAPGDLDDEDFRLQLIIREGVYYLISSFSNDGYVRVGLALSDEDLSESAFWRREKR